MNDRDVYRLLRRILRRQKELASVALQTSNFVGPGIGNRPHARLAMLLDSIEQDEALLSREGATSCH